MLNPIRLKTDCRLQSLLTRHQCAKLWNYCREQTKSGIVTLLIPEILTLFNISRSTLYRWLKQGRELGAFRYYKKTGKFTLYIVLGSKKAVTENLGLTDWGAVIEKPLEEILTKTENQLRQQTTLHHAQWLEMKSLKAAKASVGKRFKPYKPKFKHGKPTPKKEIGKPTPKNTRRATATPTCQNKQPVHREKWSPNESDQGLTPPIKLKKTAFARKHTPVGSSQKTIAEQLGISTRTVTRHLAKTESIQVMYKVTDPEEIKRAKAEIYFAIEEGKTAPYFVREGELYRFGNSLYNYPKNNSLKSEWMQRVKYKFTLFNKIYLSNLNRAPGNVSNKSCLCFNEFKELFNNFNLDSLDEIVLLIMFYRNPTKSFKEFYSELKQELRILKKWNSGRMIVSTLHTPLLAGR